MFVDVLRDPPHHDASVWLKQQYEPGHDVDPFLLDALRDVEAGIERHFAANGRDLPSRQTQ